MKKNRWVILGTLIGALALCQAKQTFATGAANDHTVLILGSSVSGGAVSREAYFAGLDGNDVEVASDADWMAKSTADFATYKSLDTGDATCDYGNFNATALTTDIWGPAVTGNVIIVGTDSVYHQSQGGDALTNGAVKFAAAEPGATGAYISLSCYYHGVAPYTPVPALSPFGGFTVTGVGCYNDAHKVAEHPALDGITDATLSNWSCSVHEAFDSYPSDLLPLAIARNAGTPDQQKCFADGSCGIPYILARGKTLSPIRCGNEVLEAPEECDDGNTINGDGCNAQCIIEYCGDGTVNNNGAEQCDDGNNVDGDGCSANCTIERVGCRSNEDCLDNTVCTTDTCDLETGKCLHEAISCDDNNACTKDSCNPELGCVYADLVCDDNSRRTNDSCNPDAGCIYDPVNCDDGNFCDGAESCDPELGCVAGSPPVCDDSNPCNGTESCNEEQGCVAGPVPTLSAMCPWVVVGSQIAGSSVVIGREDIVVKGLPGSGAGVCSMNNMSSRKQISLDGSLAVGGSSKFSSGNTPSRIKGNFVSNGGSESYGGSGVPLVGPDGSELPIDDPANPYVDRTGGHADFASCMDAASSVVPDSAYVATLAPTLSVGAVATSFGSPPVVISVGSGQQVVLMDSLKLATNTELTLDGAADTVLVVRISGRMKVGSGAKVTLSGGLTPDHVLWNAEGKGSVKLNSASEFNGTILSGERRKLRAGAFAKVHGALYGLKVQMKRQVTLDHQPFISTLLP